MAGSSAGVLDHRRFVETLLRLTPRVFVTQVLIGLNVAVFVVMVLSGVNLLSPTVEQLLRWGANYGPRTMDGQWWRLLTCMFVHVGLIHLGVNMWVLWQIGRLVERLVGNVGFALVYLLSGLGGSLTSLAWNPLTTSAGASGAVFGLFGALLGFVVLRRRSLPASAYRPLINSSIGFILYNMAFSAVIPGIDAAAHLGGLVVGLLCGVGLSLPVELESARRRLPRNLLTTLVVGLLLFSASRLLPAPGLDPIELDRRFRVVEMAAQQAFDQGAARFNEGKWSGRELADSLQREILPPYEDLLQEMRQASGQRSAQRSALGPALEKRTRYMQLRADSWQMLARSLREDDPQARQEFERLRQEADQVFTR